MAENIALEIATLQDIGSVLCLQELYLVSNLSEDEKNLVLSQSPLPLIN